MGPMGLRPYGPMAAPIAMADPNRLCCLYVIFDMIYFHTFTARPVSSSNSAFTKKRAKITVNTTQKKLEKKEKKLARTPMRTYSLVSAP